MTELLQSRVKTLSRSIGVTITLKRLVVRRGKVSTTDEASVNTSGSLLDPGQYHLR